MYIRKIWGPLYLIQYAVPVANCAHFVLERLRDVRVAWVNSSFFVLVMFWFGGLWQGPGLLLYFFPNLSKIIAF